MWKIHQTAQLPDWQQGIGSYRLVVWLYISIVLFIGALGILDLFRAVWRIKPKDRKPSDALVLGHVTGHIIFIAGCALPCISSVLKKKYISVFCFFEAFMHLLGSCLAILFLTRLCIHTYISVCVQHRKDTGIATFCKIVPPFLLFALVLPAGFSNAAMSSAGVYCFFHWNSWICTVIMFPLICISCATMTFSYFHIYKVVRQSERRTSPLRVQQAGAVVKTKPSQSRKVFIRLLFLSGGYAIGASALLVNIIATLYMGQYRNPPWLDAICGMQYSTYVLLSPIIISLTNRRYPTIFKLIAHRIFRTSAGGLQRMVSNTRVSPPPLRPEKSGHVRWLTSTTRAPAPNCVHVKHQTA